MTDIVVTGATGFVGRRFLDAALDDRHRLEAWVRSPETLDDVESDNLTIRRWEAGDELVDDSPLDGVDAVVHLAAYIPPDYGDSDEAERCFEVNSLGTLKLLEQAARAGVSKFVHLSSGNIYRPGRKAADEETETYPSGPAPYYLTSKLSGEIFVDHFRRNDAFDSTVVLRPSAIYGAGMESGVLPLFAGRLLEGERIEVHDGGHHTVDFVHVDDVVQAIDKSLAYDGSGCFNVGSGQRRTILDLARTLASICGVSDELVDVHPPDDTTATDKGFPGLDVERAKTELDYRPLAFERGLRRYVKALRSNASNAPDS